MATTLATDIRIIEESAWTKNRIRRMDYIAALEINERQAKGLWAARRRAGQIVETPKKNFARA